MVVSVHQHFWSAEKRFLRRKVGNALFCVMSTDFSYVNVAGSKLKCEARVHVCVIIASADLGRFCFRVKAEQTVFLVFL